MAAETKITITAATAQAEAKLRGFGSTLDGMSGKLRGMAAALVGVLSVRAFGALVKSSIDSADAVLKMSQASGVAIETLSGLAYAGKLSGIESEALGASMVKLTKGMADAAIGTGEAIRAYEALGINVKDSTGNLKNADTVMAEIAAKFGSMEDGANKTALAVALFGKSGAAMIPMLNQGADGLQAAHEEAAKLGLVLDNESSAAAERFNDNLTRLNAVKTGFANQIMIAMLPSLEGLSKSLFDSAANAGGLEKAATAAATGLKLMMSAGTILVGVFKTLGEYLGGVAAAAVALFAGRFREAADIASQSGRDFYANIKSSVGNVTAIFEAEAAKAEASAPFLGKKLAAPMMAAAGAAEKAQKKMASDAEKLRKEQERLLEKQNAEIQRSALEAQKIYFDLDPIAKASDAWEGYLELVKSGSLDLETAAQHYAKTFGESTDQMTTFAEQAGRNIQDAFSEFLFDPFKDGLGGMLDGFQIMLRKMAAEALASQILGSIGSWGKTGSGAGSFLGGIAASVFGGKSFAGGGFTGGGSRTGGIDGRGGFPAILHPNETVIDHDKGQGRSVTVINNFSVSTPTDRRTQEQIASMAGASIQTAMMRGA